MTRQNGDGNGWWGELRLETGGAARWRIGPLTLGVRRGRREWQLAYEWDLERATAQDWERLEDAMPEAAHQERFIVGETGERLALEPALADRPVVSRPSLPLEVLPQRETTLYVGSPVWVAVEVGEPGATLRRLPSRRLSDTWFGGSTREGELCYATQTRARLDPEDLPVLGRSALTPVVIRNLAEQPLVIERLKLPVPVLSLFGDREGRLWTEGVTLTRSEESDMAALEIREGAPEEAGEAELLSAPRTADAGGGLIRAFSSLFGFG